MFYFIINLERKKLKLRKEKYIFFNAEAEFNADADADISKWSRETTVSNLSTKIEAQKIESEHFSKYSHLISGGEQHDAFRVS